ncbi:MAG: hypothetical protein ABMA26_03495 [Limisphaerales bacterium]
MEDDNSEESGSSWLFWVGLAVFLALAAAVALPNFIKARATRAKNPCMVNLKQIDGAVQQWSLENKKTATDTYSLSDTTLLAYLKGSVLPICPDGGRYSPGTNLTDVPKCSITGHTL